MNKRIPALLIFGWCMSAAAQLSPLTVGNATATGSTAVTLAWQLSTSPNIIRQTVGYGLINGSFTNQTVVSSTTQQFQVTNLVYSTTYYFAVNCTDVNNLSSVWSVPLQYTTTNAPPPQPPAAPTGLKVLSVP
jgi:hypothetical protein